ncbi:MAG: energy-coupling factor ABC transporter ATP-binding protein, partial [Planctomycetes bacterium]|nr:energy-coupling factor ABC transporter ATP-binding protein [Planctomycetota bacterium]
VTAVTPATGNVIIRVSDLEVALGCSTILADINLEVRTGEVIAILGPNGGGKSTLLSALVGLIPPTRGAVRLFGSPVSPRRVSRLARQVGYVFQNADHQLVADTVWGEALYAARVFKIMTPTIEEEADQLLNLGGLADRKRDHPYRLSWGEKRRLNLISAVLHRPRLLLLDEPFAGQDWANAVFLLDVVLQRLTNAGAVPVEILRRPDRFRESCSDASRSSPLTKGGKRGVARCPNTEDALAPANVVLRYESARTEARGPARETGECPNPGAPPEGSRPAEVGACLMVTHDPRIVLRCCTRLLFVFGGQVAVDAPVARAFTVLAEMGYDAYVPPEFLAGQRGSPATGSSDGPLSRKT